MTLFYRLAVDRGPMGDEASLWYLTLRARPQDPVDRSAG
jgi:hypothetical protein